MLTATSVGETIRGLNVVALGPRPDDCATLRAGLEAPLAGMGTAFFDLVFGLASSARYWVPSTSRRPRRRNRFANELESWLSDPTSLAGGVSA